MQLTLEARNENFTVTVNTWNVIPFIWGNDGERIWCARTAGYSIKVRDENTMETVFEDSCNGAPCGPSTFDQLMGDLIAHYEGVVEQFGQSTNLKMDLSEFINKEFRVDLACWNTETVNYHSAIPNGSRVAGYTLEVVDLVKREMLTDEGCNGSPAGSIPVEVLATELKDYYERRALKLIA